MGTITHQSSEAGYLALLGESLRQYEHVEVDTLTLAELSNRTGLGVKLLSQARQELEKN